MGVRNGAKGGKRGEPRPEQRAPDQLQPVHQRQDEADGLKDGGQHGEREDGGAEQIRRRGGGLDDEQRLVANGHRLRADNDAYKGAAEHAEEQRAEEHRPVGRAEGQGHLEEQHTRHHSGDVEVEGVAQAEVGVHRRTCRPDGEEAEHGGGEGEDRRADEPKAQREPVKENDSVPGLPGERARAHLGRIRSRMGGLGDTGGALRLGFAHSQAGFDSRNDGERWPPFHTGAVNKHDRV